MPKRIRKQIIYGTFFLLVWVLLIGGVYFRFFKPAASCHDHIKNQDETEIDCGGVCSNICKPIHALPIVMVGNPLIFTPVAGHESILAQVTNPNLDYAAKSFSYIFTLSDASGTAIKTFSGDSFMYPGEAKYILVPNFDALNFSKIDFSVENIKWVPSAETKGAPNIVLVGANMNSQDGNLVVEGSISNKDAITIPKITVLATFTGSLGEVLVGVSETEIDDLSPGENRSFSIVHPNIATVDLNATKIYIYAQRP